MSVQVYHKAQIIAIMREVMKRLRKQQRFIPDVIDAMAYRGVVLTRARVDDMFMTRPDRDVIIPHEVMQALIAVLFDFDADILQADEFLALAVATRMPIDQLQRYARYFPKTQWQTALQQHGIQVRTPHPQRMLVGRDLILKRVYAQMIAQHHILLTGPAGIGKTAVALELMRRYEMYNGQPLYYIDARSITTLAQLYEQLASVFQVKPLVHEPILLRLQLVLSHKIVYVLLENLDGTDGSLTPPVVMANLHTHLPMLRCVVTSRIPAVLAHMAACHEEAIPALDTAHVRDTACQLFMQIYQQRGGRAIAPAYVLESCRAVAGNPLAISMIASAVVRDPNAQVADDFVWRNIRQLDTNEMRLVTLISATNLPLTRRFLGLLSDHAWHIPAQTLTQLLDTLAQRRVVYVVQSDDVSRVEVHAVIRQVIIHVVPSAHIHQLLIDVFHALDMIDMRWEDRNTHSDMRFDTSDLQCLLGFAAALLAYMQVTAAAQLLTKGRVYWVRYGLCDEAIPLCERCMAIIGANHPLSSELSFTLGSLYGARGLIPLALTYLQRAYTSALQQQQMELVCRITCEIGMNGIIDTSDPPQISFAAICGYFDVANTYLAEFPESPLRAAVYDLYAYVLLVAGDLAQAVHYNDAAIAIYEAAKSTRGLIDAYHNRGLILLTLGEFAPAQQALRYVKTAFSELNIPLAQAQCSLRSAAIAQLAGDVPATRAALADALHVLSRAGGMQDMLYIMDVYAGLLMLQGAYAETVGLCERIQHFRTERHIFRGRQLDFIFQQQLAVANQHVHQSAVPLERFVPRLTFYDVIRLIRADLLGE